MSDPTGDAGARRGARGLPGHRDRSIAGGDAGRHAHRAAARPSGRVRRRRRPTSAVPVRTPSTSAFRIGAAASGQGSRAPGARRNSARYPPRRPVKIQMANVLGARRLFNHTRELLGSFIGTVRGSKRDAYPSVCGPGRRARCAERSPICSAPRLCLRTLLFSRCACQRRRSRESIERDRHSPVRRPLRRERARSRPALPCRQRHAERDQREVIAAHANKLVSAGSARKCAMKASLRPSSAATSFPASTPASTCSSSSSNSGSPSRLGCQAPRPPVASPSPPTAGAARRRPAGPARPATIARRRWRARRRDRSHSRERPGESGARGP